MSYVDAIYDKRNSTVRVIERRDGKRVTKDYPCEWSFYYDDPKGKYETIFRTPVSYYSTNSYKDYQLNLAMHKHKRLWESDINIVNKTLQKHYLGVQSPKLNICFFDIEVDFSPTLGFAPTDDPFNKVTAISLYCTWLNDMITLAIPPNSLSLDEATELVKDFPNTYLFDDEVEMFNTFFEIIDDADVMSGWNSEGYDVPYMVNRTARIMSNNDTRRFCLNNQLPKKREYEKYGKMQVTYDFSGRIHLDSLNLYQKYTYHEMHSYSLDTIAEYELKERKVQYAGTLDQLYNEDFYKFIEYNRQDTMILKKLDDQLQFIDLANEIAHDNTVLIPSAMGAVGVTDQALTNYAHSLGFVVPNKTKQKEDKKAAGAYVAFPKKGIHKYVGAIDINSLYPSAIRALNMSPETIVCQMLPTYTEPFIQEQIKKHDKLEPFGGDVEKKKAKSFAAAWEGQFGSLEYQYVHQKDETKRIEIDWAVNAKKKNSTVHTADEAYDIVFHGGEKWMLSGNGTVFHYNFQGIVPGILEKWYAERQELQAKKKAAEVIDDSTIEVPNDIMSKLGKDLIDD